MSKEVYIKSYKTEKEYNYSLSFAGDNDYISLANLGLGGNVATTVELWFNLDSIANNRCFFSFGTAVTNQFFLCEWIGASSYFRFDYGNNALNSSVVALSTGTWYHIAFVKTTSTRAIYLNGVLIGSDSPANPNFSNTNYNIGRRNDNVEYVDGKIQEVRVWNVARTQQQISENYAKKLTGTETGLVGYWRINDGTGTTATATVGTNGTLTNFSGTYWITTTTAPIYKQTYKGFSDDYSFSSIKSTLNSGFDSVTFTLPREFDNYGLGSTIGLDSYLLKVVAYDTESTTGTTLFQGNSIIIDSSVDSKESVTVTAAGVIERLKNTPLISAAGSYEVSYSAVALETIFKDIIYNYNALNPQNILTFTASSIQATGKTGTMKFNNANCLNALEEVFNLTASTWVWFVDVNNVVWLKALSATVQHYFFFGKDVLSINRSNDKTKLVNNVLFWNGASGGSSIARRYYNDTSIATYGLHTEVIRDGRFTTSGSMDDVGNRTVTNNKVPNDQITFDVLDSAGGGYDIESIKVGDVVKILNIGTAANLPSSLVVTTKTDYLNGCTLVCADRETYVDRELQGIKEQQQKVNYEAGPTTYTGVAVS